MKIALFPGSFDPFHKGHLKLIQKALKIFDKIIVVVSNNEQKQNNKTLNYRFDNVKKNIINLENVEVIINDNELTANLSKKLGINFLIRGARNNIDFQYEIYLATEYKKINPKLEIILIFPDYEELFLRSSKLKLKKENK